MDASMQAQPGALVGRPQTDGPVEAINPNAIDPIVPQALTGGGYLRPIDRIQKVMNGYVVNIGCQILVFTSLTTMLQEMERYFKDPGAVEKQYWEHSNQTEFQSPPPAAGQVF